MIRTIGTIVALTMLVTTVMAKDIDDHGKGH